MSMSIYNNSTPISLDERLDRREKDQKMGLGRLTGARVDDGLDRAAGIPTLPDLAARLAEDAKERIRGAKNAQDASDSKDSAQQAPGRVPDAEAARETSENSRSFIVQQASTAISAQANQSPQAALRLLQKQA